MTVPVTLLTDFGTADYFVGAMKGVIISRAPGAPIVDLTHEIAPGDVRAAAFTLLAARDAFPEGTVHVAVVDPGVGSARRALVAAALGQLFVAPDNGLLSWVLDRDPGATVRAVTNGELFRRPLSATFHGRDLFAPVGASLAAGFDPAEVGPPIADPVRLPAHRPTRLPDGSLRATILHVDRFGNCVTSLTRDDAPAVGATLRVKGHEIRATRRFYADGEGGDPFTIPGSAGFLEISVNGASAAERLGVAVGDEVVVNGESLDANDG